MCFLRNAFFYSSKALNHIPLYFAENIYFFIVPPALFLFPLYTGFVQAMDFWKNYGILKRKFHIWKNYGI